MNKKTLLFSFLLISVNLAFSTVHTIVNSGFTFSPATLTIDAGDSVQFTIGGAHFIVEVDQTTWDANGNTPQSGGFTTPAGGGLILPADLDVGTHYYVCSPHAGMGMKGQIIVEPSTAKIEKENEFSFSVYPNPTSGMLFLDIKGINMGEVNSLKVYSISGAQVEDIPLINNSALDLSSLTKGIYFVQIKAGDAIMTRKIALQ